MKIIRTASGKRKIKMSKSEWTSIGKIAGWDNDNNDDDDDDDNLEIAKNPEELLTFTYGLTPPPIISLRANLLFPSGYSMHIKNQDDWSIIAKIVNQGIDSHLEGFTKSSFDSNGQCVISPDELPIFLRRLYDADESSADELRTSILYTLNIEEV